MARKKIFSAPAEQFLTISRDPEPVAVNAPPKGAGEKSQQKEKAPDGMKVNPMYIEKRTQRVQLVLQPSLFAKVKDMAKGHGQSVNDFIHTMLEITVGKG